MLLRTLCLCALTQLFAHPVLARSAEDLSRVLRIDDVIEVMREEGLAYGADLEAELFPGAGGARWKELVADIYDPAAMQRDFQAVFGPDMADDEGALAASLDFFGNDRGQRIVALELAAREALLQESVEEVARSRVDEMRKAEDPRLAMITRFAEANDLIEQNVAGALNANLAFYRGMLAGGAFAGGLTEGEILADVWSQETEIREETQDWLFPFLTLSYDPLSDDDLLAYLAFSETGPGQVLNAALFAGFEALFASISEDLGRAAAVMLSGQDL